MHAPLASMQASSDHPCELTRTLRSVTPPRYRGPPRRGVPRGALRPS
jgi:hypothetical protein